eukprot:1146208-Pelagomonas_calceolata.AAC.16
MPTAFMDAAREGASAQLVCTPATNEEDVNVKGQKKKHTFAPDCKPICVSKRPILKLTVSQ